jgi:hypothetical protein
VSDLVQVGRIDLESLLTSKFSLALNRSRKLRVQLFDKFFHSYGASSLKSIF